MRRSHLLCGLAAASAAAALAGLVAAQDNKTAPAPPAVGAPTATAPPATTPPVVTTPPNTPVAKGLATAVTPDEGAPPPKAETTIKPVAKLVAPPTPKAPTEPMQRARFDSAVLQAVDKITAETLRFESKVGEPVRYKGLILTVRSCETTAPDEAQTDNVAYLDVQSQPISSPGHANAAPRQVFRGWMFASSPALHPFEHPIYDVWLIACKASAPVAPVAILPKSPAAPAKAAAKRT